MASLSILRFGEDPETGELARLEPPVTRAETQKVERKASAASSGSRQRARTHSVPAPRRPYRTLDDAFFRQIAQVVVRARASGGDATAQVQLAWGTTQRNVNRWIREAENRGFVTEEDSP